MVQSNYEILGIREEATKIEIRDAFRKLVLEHHSDRGGDDEQFKKIKRAFDDLKLGKKFPDSIEEKSKKSRFYSGDSEEEKRKRNLILSRDVAKEVARAQEWAAALNRTDATDVRLFGSKELGQLEFERKATKSLSIKGKFWAGNLSYDNSIIMWGSITNPYFSENQEEKTVSHVKDGKFSLIDPLENGYLIENGATILVDNGDIIVGDVYGKKEILPDPSGRVGMFITLEHFTELKAPRGKIVGGFIRNTVKLEADSIMVINLEDNVKVKGRDISILGNKVTYDVEITLMKDGKIKFHDQGSGFGISDDAILKLENGKEFRLHDLKKSQMIGYGGAEIRYDYLDEVGAKRQNGSSKSWKSKFGFGN
ncbi:MAG TPA: J domain-containing protein [Nitrosopumilaceae archaeon]|nr:J domain-containing protein [Nitrosopumilaceae archaeon]